MRKKLFTFLLALVTSVGMMNATSPAVNGKLPGAFSVSSTEQVYFSQGNLQYQASTNTWRFAEKQWNFVGGDPDDPLVKGNVSENAQLSNNSQISSSYNGWIDLFGWATSGNSASGTAYQPWANSADASEYGPAITSGEWTTANSDWGINAISNGGNTANAWRTLTQAEWNYLLMEREGNRFAYARLTTPSYSYVYGLIILPDDWNTEYYALNSINETNHAYTSNTMTTETWESSLEAHGAVFLPVTGIRGESNIYGLDGDNSEGLYWSSTAGELHDSYYDSEMEQEVAIDVVNAAYGLRFSGGWFLQTSSITSRASGIAVRLVAATPGGSTPTSSETLNFVNQQTTVTGTNFQCVGTMNANVNGWRVYNNSGTAQTLTVSSLNGTTLIKKIEFTSALGAQRTNEMLSVSEGTLSFDGNDPSTTVTINNINATSVTISGSGTNAGKTWYINSVKVYYDAPAPTSFTFPAGTTIYYDFTAYGNGINVYAPGAPTDWYSSPDNIIPVTLSSDWEISASTNLFKSKASGWDFVTGTILPTDGQNMIVSTNGVDYAWGTHVPTYTVAGEPAVAFGTPTWTPTNTNNDMVKQSNGTYKWEKEDVELAKDAVVSFKVCQDYGWDVAYPSNNFNHTIPADGIYTLTITFDPNAEGDKVAIDATKTADVVVAQTAEMKGFGDWNTGIALENINEGAAARVTKNLAAGDHEFKMVINDGWRGKVGATITRANNTVAEIVGNPNESNITLTADIPGDYIFTWTYAENTLSVEFPSLVVYVQNLIAAIGEVTLESGDAIHAARTAYDNLLDADQKQAVNNYDVLIAAEAAYALLHDQVAANAVKDLIDAIDNPVVYTQACKDKIDAARAAYDALTDAQKTLVGDEYAQKLADAEAAYDAFIVYTVAGEPAVAFGTPTWAPTNTNNDMVKQLNGTYKWEKEDVELAKDAVVSFKVCKDHAWAGAYPDDNFNHTILADGIYTLTITFDPNAEGDKVAINALKTADVVVAQTAEMKGFGDWNTGIALENINEGAAARVTKNLAAGDHEFKMVINDGWRGKVGATITRANNSVAEIVDNPDNSNITLTADIPGCYTFTWTYETNTLEIGYPSLTMDVAAIVNNQAGTIVLPAEQVEGTQLNFGVAADGSRVEADAPNAIMTVAGSFKNEHGMQSPTFTVMVPGSVDIYVGKCTYSTKTINVRNANNDIVASKTPTAACWKTDHANMTVLHYTGEATTLTISGMDFCPYIRVKNAPVVDPLPAYINVQAQVNNQAGTLLTSAETAAQGNAVSLGVNEANERVAADAANAIMTVAGNYHSEHGLTNSVFTVRVPGNVDIYVGECTYSNKTIKVTDEDNNLVASVTPATACWKNDHNNVAVLHYVGGANTLTISGMQYCPYVCVKSTPVEVPAEMDIQAIVNNQAGTLVAQAEQVQGTPLNFGVAADGSRVAVDNPNAILYVDGKYHNDHGMYNPTFTVRVPGEVEIYVGECTYSTATIEVRNAANELVDSKTPDAECWKNNPDNVAVLHYTGEATTLTISGMTYCPFIRVKTPTAPVQITIGDPNNATEIEAFLTNNDGVMIDEVIIDRPVYNNMYNTLCLPFDMNAAQIAASSLNGVEIREFTGASVDGTTLNLSVGDPVNAVVAGRPYFVKYSAASQLDNLHFEDVTINKALLDNMAVTFDGVTFKGTFTPFVMPNGLNFQGGYLFLGQNNQLFWPNTSNPLKPFRAYFYVDVESSTPGNAPKYRGMLARIVEGKNVVTGVESIQQSAVSSQKFIENGQLIIIKNDVRYNAQGQVVK